jgi:hypothetical protein
MCELSLAQSLSLARAGPHTHTQQQRPTHFFSLFFEGIQLNSYRSFFFLLSMDKKKKKKYIGSLCWAKGQKNEMKIIIPFCTDV